MVGGTLRRRCRRCSLGLALLALALLATPSVSRELHRLEPDAGPTLHCGGQESDTSQYVDAAGGAFARYSEFMGANAAAPAVQMWYTSLLGETFSSPGSGAAWGRVLAAALDNHTKESTLIIPQIGLNLPSGQDLAHVTTPAGLAAIDEFGRGLQALERPAFVRIGYEFNGGWNDYPPTLFKAAWKAVTASQQWPATAASVWDYSCDASAKNLNASDWWPGDDARVDWWGVNIFGTPGNGASMPNSPCVQRFVDQAAAAGFPVMLGESTPRSRGVLNSHGYLLASVREGLCLTVSGGDVDPGGALVMARCGVPPARPAGAVSGAAAAAAAGAVDRWFITNLSSATDPAHPQFSTSTLQNENGLCVAISDMNVSVGAPGVAWLCGGGEDKIWSYSQTAAGGILKNGLGACLWPGQTVGSAATVGACNGETTTGESHDAAGGDGNWVLHPIPGSSGAETWAEWFVPYLKLMAHPAVKAACYIDWNWRDTTNDHEFSW